MSRIDWNDLKVVFLDVDGTMTDSGIYYDDSGKEWKKFSTRDFAGIMAAHYIEIKIIVLTGRECEATTKRMKEMKVDALFQNVKNKLDFVKEYIVETGLDREEIGYIGDDLNDYAAMKIAGFKGCPADACEEIKNIADYISPLYGGKGVIQDIFRYILESKDLWNNFIEDIVEKGY